MKTNRDEIEKILDNPIEIEKEYNTEWKEIEIEQEIVWESLTPRQERFCQLYTTDSWCFGNWVTTYLEVYDVDTEKKWWYKTACACSSRLLSNAKVYNRINELLDENGMNNEFVDKQILFLLSQQADLNVKLWAIKEYNKLKQRITEKIESTWTIEFIIKE